MSRSSGLVTRLSSVSALASAVLGLAVHAPACTGAQYRADGEHARLVAPVALAEGDTGKAPLSAKASSRKRSSAPKGSSAAGPSPGAEAQTAAASGAPARQPSELSAENPPGSPPSTAPDPPPLDSVRQFELDFEYDAGRVSLTRVRSVSSERALQTARVMGRYAVELWIGRELIERVRFDFPLIGAEVEPGERAPLNTLPNLGAKAHVFRTVRVPADSRATWAQLVDRATGETWRLQWPPLPLGQAAVSPRGSEPVRSAPE